MNQPNREELLCEGLVAKFLRYVQVDSPSSPEGTEVPSTPEQWDMARLVEAELKALGLADVKVDEHAIVTATLPGNKPGAPVVGFLAHLDTVSNVPARGVKPILHRNYAGGPIQLPAGLVIDPEECKDLNRCIGHDIITSDGSTLLGADDKSGIAAIMEMLCTLIKDPAIPHGDLRVAFTPDEETGKGAKLFDVAGFGAVAAYTADGGLAGEVQSENFNSKNVKVTLTGRSSHAGSARGVMINALQLAAELIGAIPANMRPETTDGYLGFIHPNKIVGGQEQVTINVLLRDFTREGIEHKYAIMEGLLKSLELRFPGTKAEMQVTGGRPNMREAVSQDPRIVSLAVEAVRAAGVEPRQTPIRGGSDGATLTGMGLPCPNLFMGSTNYHSRSEWASVQYMGKLAETMINLARLWATKG